MSAKNEYHGFLRWLHQRANVSDDAKRVANIVHANFANIEATSPNQSQRTRVLVPLLRDKLDQTAPMRGNT